MTAYHFRTGNIQDTEQLQALGLNAYGQYKQFMSEENWHKMRTFLSADKLYTDLFSKANCFVCEYDQNIVGMAFLMPSGNPTEIFQAAWSYLRIVAVHSEHNGQGIAKKLTQMCINFAKENQETIVALHTSEYMNAARHIYEGMGFKQIREIESNYGMRYWLYQMEI